MTPQKLMDLILELEELGSYTSAEEEKRSLRLRIKTIIDRHWADLTTPAPKRDGDSGTSDE